MYISIAISQKRPNLENNVTAMLFGGCIIEVIDDFNYTSACTIVHACTKKTKAAMLENVKKAIKSYENTYFKYLIDVWNMSIL